LTKHIGNLSNPFSEAKLQNIVADAMNTPSDVVECVNESCGNCTCAAVDRVCPQQPTAHAILSIHESDQR
jgi:hypothetical protein